MPSRIFGILNLTTDSFSDGGKYLEPATALAHARAMHTAGAHCIDVGAASSHPDSPPVPAETEIQRLGGVLPALRAEGIRVSVDSYQPAVQRYALTTGCDFLNDIQGFANPEIYDDLARASDVRLVVMHSVQSGGGADRSDVPADEIMGRIFSFFDARLSELQSAGVARERLVIDPGMGFFLGTHADTSLRVLSSLTALQERYSVPVLVSVSRKSFLGALTGRPPMERGAASLAAELSAVHQGVDYIRTHDVRALQDALTIHHALNQINR